ncbi:kinase-like domain-containing protein [Tanacetum coccineum]
MCYHSSSNTSKLNLLQRINILKDVATVLDYLHIAANNDRSNTKAFLAGKGSKKKKIHFIILVIVIAPTLLIAVCCVHLFCKRKQNSQPSQSSGNERFLKVSYSELLKATDGFSTTNLIGEGGFSSVYKGILDSNEDKFVAVKVLHLQNQGAHKSFLAECDTVRLEYHTLWIPHHNR